MPHVRVIYSSLYLAFSLSFIEILAFEGGGIFLKSAAVYLGWVSRFFIYLPPSLVETYNFFFF